MLTDAQQKLRLVPSTTLLADQKRRLLAKLIEIKRLVAKKRAEKSLFAQRKQQEERFGDEDAAAKDGWLQHWEGIGRGYSLGHTIREHVGKKDSELIARLNSNSNLRSASTFTDQATAEAVISEAISANRNVLNSWMRNAKPGDRLPIYHRGAGIIGRGATRGEGVSDRTNVRIILQMRDNGKYHILTAWPE